MRVKTVKSKVTSIYIGGISALMHLHHWYYRVVCVYAETQIKYSPHVSHKLTIFFYLPPLPVYSIILYRSIRYIYKNNIYK